MIEFSNVSWLRGARLLNGGRIVETADGRGEVRNLRALGCPDDIASRIERRNAARAGTVTVSNDEDAELKSKLDALKAL